MASITKNFVTKIENQNRVSTEINHQVVKVKKWPRALTITFSLWASICLWVLIFMIAKALVQ